jgi:peptidyl-prolyl cis-trans isomerase A (cyclophilin A)
MKTSKIVLTLSCILPLFVVVVGCASSKTSRLAGQRALAANRPHVLIQTELGNIEAQLYQKEAPISVANFLRYVQGGFFDGGRFFRTVTMDNQPNDKVKIQVIQAEAADPNKADRAFAPIPLERTRDTGLSHLDGSLSMARDVPDSAQHSFSICVGDQPELNFGGRRNPDGQGFAVFGRVVKGMDVVHQIHTRPAQGQQLTPPVHILRVQILEKRR